MSSVRNGTNGTADPAKWPPKFDIWRQDFELEVGNQRPKGVCVYIYVYIYICICLYYDDITCMSTECVQIDVVDIEMKFMICD